MPHGSMVRLDHRFIQNPDALYRALQVRGPAHRVELWGGFRAWLVTGYAEARALLTDARLTKNADRLLALLPPGTDSLLGPSLRGHMLLKDPPDHTRLRKLVTKAFTARAVAKLRVDIGRIVDELLTHLPDGEVDLIKSFATPVPLAVISTLLGVPPAYRSRFRDYVEPILTVSDPSKRRPADEALADLLSGLIAVKRATPADDLLTALAEASEGGECLSEEELLSTAFLLILAGYETTVGLIGNGILALLQNPDQLAKLRADMSLLPSAIEELLRIGSPVNIATARATTEPVSLGAVEIPANELVMIGLLAANHDAVEFATPGQMDITRKPNNHLAFGHGIHYCLGAPLARLEAEVAISGLLAHFDPITLQEGFSPRYRSSILMRSLLSLPVQLQRTGPERNVVARIS